MKSITSKVCFPKNVEVIVWKTLLIIIYVIQKVNIIKQNIISWEYCLRLAAYRCTYQDP